MSIILLQPSARATNDDNDNDNSLDVVHPPLATPQYSFPHLSSSRIPSLSFLCLRRLAEFPDELYHLPVRLRIADHSPLAADISDAVNDSDTVHPCLWAALVQVYDNLPTQLASFSVPLADPYVLLLQRIPATPRFTLLTILDLPACIHLTDDTVSEITRLHSLTAFDASATTLSSYAITVLARTLQWSIDRHHRGLWGLRVLRLRDCASVENSVYPLLARFPLLSIVDLRGTACVPNNTIHDAFRPADPSQVSFYHPSSLHAALQALSSPSPLYSSPHTFTLRINSLYHGPPPLRPSRSTVAPQNTFVVIPPAESDSAITTGDSEVLRRHLEKAQEIRRREENRENCYTRNLQYNAKPLEDFNTKKSRDSFYDLNDKDGDVKTLLRQKSTLKRLPPISKPINPSYPSKYNDQTPQHPNPSTPTLRRTPLDIQPAQRRLGALLSSSWIGHTQSSTRKLSHALPVRPMPRSSVLASSSPASVNQRPLISASTAAFYSTIPANPHASHRPKFRSQTSTWDWDYSADRYYTGTPREKKGKHDAALMLYRPPPPWDDLFVKGVNTQNTYGKRVDVLSGAGILRVRHVEKVAAVIDQRRIEAVREREGERQAALVALQECAKRNGEVLHCIRHKGENGTSSAANSNTSLGTTMNQRRNPFRRREAATIGEIKGATIKPLKPISAVKIPLLPESTSGLESRKRKTMSNTKVSEPSMARKHPDSDTTVIMVARKLRPTRAQPGDEKATRRKSIASLGSGPWIKKRRLSEPARGIEGITPASKGAGTSQQGFDWSNWGVQ